MSLCTQCNGTGKNIKSTQQYLQTTVGKIQGGYVACWHCNGNGLEPYYPNSERVSNDNSTIHKSN